MSGSAGVQALSGFLDEDNPVREFLDVASDIQTGLQLANKFGVYLPESIAESMPALAGFTQVGSIASQMVNASTGLTTAVPGSQAWMLAEQTAEFGMEGLKATMDALKIPGGAEISSFLKTPVGGGIASALMTGIMTGDWESAAKVGIGTAIGNIIFPGIGGMVGGFLASLIGGGDKPSRPRFQIMFRPDMDDAEARSNSGGTFHGHTYGSAHYTRDPYTGKMLNDIEGYMEKMDETTDDLLAALGLQETKKQFMYRAFQGGVYISGGYINSGLSGNFVDEGTDSSQRMFGVRGDRTNVPRQEDFQAALSELQEEVIRASAIDSGNEAQKRFAKTFVGDTKDLVLGLAKAGAMTMEEADEWLDRFEQEVFNARMSTLEKRPMTEKSPGGYLKPSFTIPTRYAYEKEAFNDYFGRGSVSYEWGDNGKDKYYNAPETTNVDQSYTQLLNQYQKDIGMSDVDQWNQNSEVYRGGAGGLNNSEKDFLRQNPGMIWQFYAGNSPELIQQVLSELNLGYLAGQPIDKIKEYIQTNHPDSLMPSGW